MVTRKESIGILAAGALAGAFLYREATVITDIIKGRDDSMELIKKEGASCESNATEIKYNRAGNAEVLRIWDNDGITNHYFWSREGNRVREDRALTFLAVERSFPDVPWRITDLNYTPLESTPDKCQRELHYLLDKVSERWDIKVGIERPYSW